MILTDFTTNHLLSFQEVIQHDAVILAACDCIFAILAKIYTVDFT